MHQAPDYCCCCTRIGWTLASAGATEEAALHGPFGCLAVSRFPTATLFRPRGPARGLHSGNGGRRQGQQRSGSVQVGEPAGALSRQKGGYPVRLKQPLQGFERAAVHGARRHVDHDGRRIQLLGER
ncbi:MAG: hypothetical protein R6V12_07890, partial [Candidatus Hydrogenedentota bacterium]